MQNVMIKSAKNEYQDDFKLTSEKLMTTTPKKDNQKIQKTIEEKEKLLES